MASPLYNLLMGTDTSVDTVRLMHENDRLSEDQEYMATRVAEVEEDLLRISDAFDRRGTMELTGMPDSEANEIPLKTVKKVAETSRAMMAMNPFIKRGVEARIGYIWGKGISFDNVDGIKTYLDENRKRLFSPQALMERERVLATDGNMFVAHPVQAYIASDDATSFRVPLDEIVGCVANPDDREDIRFYKREWSVTTVNSTTGKEKTTTTIKYYPSMGYAAQLEKKDKPLPRRWSGNAVEQNYVMQHEAVNKQVGWRWGVPDIMPVIFWAKAYKEYLEDNATLVKAYSRLAWQVKIPTGASGPGIAAQLAGTQDGSVGGTMLGGGGLEMAPLATNASSIDFSKGKPLASAIAAGLEISQTVLTSDSGTTGSNAAEQSLDLPTLKAMETRQQLHTESFMELFEYWGADDPIVTWPQIFSDSTKDRIAAIGTADELGRIYPEESRKMMIDTLGFAPVAPWDELPDPADDPKEQYKAEQAELAFQKQQKLSNDAAAATTTVTNGSGSASKPGSGSAVAKQGVSGGVSAKGGAQTSANQSRTNRKTDSKNS